jgi:uncharacterized protein (TIGR03084 family)
MGDDTAAKRRSVIHEIGLDVRAEGAALDALLSSHPASAWATPTPATGWTVADAISHLAYFDEVGTLALQRPTIFEAERDRIVDAVASEAPGDLALARELAPAELADRWRRGRADLLEAALGGESSRRVPWFGPTMSIPSFLTARLMETWAHGQDVVDALGARPILSDRLRHVCHLGVATRGWSYAIRALDEPASSIRVELVGPGGEEWAWGPPDATERVAGSAAEFAAVVTQRRNVDDTSLRVDGADAAHWLRIAQSFAGPPGDGRPPGMQPIAPSGDEGTRR